MRSGEPPRLHRARGGIRARRARTRRPRPRDRAPGAGLPRRPRGGVPQRGAAAVRARRDAVSPARLRGRGPAVLPRRLAAAPARGRPTRPGRGDARARVAALAGRFAGSKLVILIHTRPEDIEWHKDKLGDDDAAITAEQRKDLQQRLAAKADLLVGVGPRLATAAAMHVFLTDPKPPVHRLDPGFHTVQRPSDLPPEIHCLVLGRAEDATLKGLDIAARALGRVARRNRLTAPPRLIVRGAPSGTGNDLRKWLVDFAEVQLDIEVRPYSPDVERLQRDIRASSLVLMPSRSEGFGLVGLEAIAAGTPVLVSDQSGLSFLLRERLGKLAEPAIVETHSDLDKAAPEWERAIESVLQDRQAAFARAATLRNTLALELTWPEAIRRLEAAWSALFADHPAA